MHTLITDYGYLVATTIGVFKLDLDFNLIPNSPNKPPHSVSMLTHFQNEILGATFDSGIVNFTTEKVLSEQLVGNSFLTLLNHKDQSLWSSSHSGIFSYEPPYIRHFDIENGFNISEYDQLSAHQDSNGVIYYGGIGGVVKFNPEDLHLFPSYPKILTHYNYKLLDINSHIKLPFDKSEISLAINPVILSDRNYFKVEIVFNDSSILISEPQKIVLKVPYKDSKILLKVTDLVHHQSRISEFNVYRQIPFWKKTWFILLSIILFILLVIGTISFVGFLKTRKLLKKEQADKKITEERLRISKELHDNIGARITHIISSLDVEMYHRKEDAKSIETINSFARETMAQLRETIWAVSDKTIFFSEFALRLEQYINQVNSLSISNITFKQDPITDFELNPIQTINFYRIIQEAVNNAVKYAKASAITVRVTSSEKIVAIQVQDNGQGFDTNSTHGTGLKGMQGRASEANGKTIIESNSNGTTITLTF
jgi:signal transduction histidine kinase